MKTVFAGTPEFAAVALDALIRAEDAPLAAGLSCTPANLEQIMVHLEREAEA